MREELRAAAASEVDRWERQLSDELNRLFDRQQAVVLARLQGAKARKHTRHWEGQVVDGLERKIDPRYIADPARWVMDAVGSVTPIVTRLFGSVYARVAKALDPSVPEVPEEDSPEARQLAEAVEARVSQVQERVAEAVEEVQTYIASEDAAGSKMPAIVAGVRQLYADRQPKWADGIAGMATTSSINQAALFAAADRGSSAKQWLSRRDNRVRDTHEAADGQVRLLDERFRLGGIPSHPKRSLLLFPGDPAPSVPLDEIIGCRCTLLFSPPRKRPAAGTKALPKTETCSEKGCDNQATKRVLWAEGMAYQPSCDRHVDAVKRRILAKNGNDFGEIVGVRDIKLLAGDHLDTDDLGDLETKRASRGPARVRTVGGAQQYGQAIGTVIVRDPSTTALSFSAGSTTAPKAASPAPAAKPRGKIAGLDVELAGKDPQVRALIAQHSAPNSPPDEASTEVLALRDRKGRVSGYVVWQTQDGPQPKGSIVTVSVHPAMKGQRLGDQMVAAVAAADPSVTPTSRPTTTPAAPGGGGSRTAPPAPVARAAAAPTGLPAVRDRSQAGDQPGTSGDFDADAKRIDRLQKSYLRDGADTTSLFSRGGRYTRDRERQQQAIIDHFLNQPGVKKDRKILVIGGLPGAGKTTSINSAGGQQALGVDLADYVTVNADEVKEQMIARGMVPDYPGLSPDEAATLFHKESFEVAHSLMRQAAKDGKNFAYDTSLKTAGQLGFATDAARRTAPPGWETTVLFVDVPPAVAKQRARDRYLAGGRYMPLALIDGMRSSSPRHSSLPSQQFDTVKRGVDRWVAMDNAGAGPVVTGQGGRAPRTSRPPRAAAAPAPAARPVAAPVAPAAPAYVPSAPAPVQTVAPSGNPLVPDPPPGAQVYSHPQGKTIHVLPDGTLIVYKPDGKRGTSSATAAKLAAGHGGWSLVAAAPGNQATRPAPASAPKLVAQPSAPLQVSASTPAPVGSMPVSPMDFNEAPLADVPKFIADPNVVFQQKVDGIRGVLVVEPGRAPWFAGKKGDRLQSSTAAKITTPMLAKMPTPPAGTPAYRVEGELLNGKFHVFDMVIVGQEQMPYEQRMKLAEAWTDEVGKVLPSVEALPTAKTAAQKQALWDAVVNSGAEGVMMKRRDSSYDGGARVNHTLKAKITATADVVVLATNLNGKANAQVGLKVGGQVQPIGTVTTIGKGPIAVGDVLEVEYLWATADSSLAQPRIVRSRPDKTPNDVTDSSQLRVVDKTVLAVAKKWLAAQIERAELALEGAS